MPPIRHKNSTVVTIRDDSYRLREKRRSGLVKTSDAGARVNTTPESEVTARP